MKLEDFDYPLPKELIAQSPLEKRDASKLLVVDRKTGHLTDRSFSDLLELIPSGDVLVLNDTKVFPARILGKKKLTGGKVDVLLLCPTVEERVWRCLVQPSLKEGQVVVFEGDGVFAEAVLQKRSVEGIPTLCFQSALGVRELAERIGSMPLPPYIKREAAATDRTQYQTVYADKEGAVAAPTAGLHFTWELLDALAKKGVDILRVTLHVGYGTFKPVEELENHRMHCEDFELTAEAADKINSAKSEKRKVWAVGTTTLRTLETCVRKKRLIPGQGQTDLFVKVPFSFEVVDHLITNFHLPKTTLLLLASAFAGENLRKKAYEHAIAGRYRFYSYGDAMLIL